MEISHKIESIKQLVELKARYAANPEGVSDEEISAALDFMRKERTALSHSKPPKGKTKQIPLSLEDLGLA